MLWDCAHCGARKNLGLTHRHCPACGSPQDATRRYFPPDEEKVAVEDHVFVGADVRCAFCQALSSRAAKHCGGCGGPLEQGAEAARRADQVGKGPFAGESVAAAEQEHAGQRAAALGIAAPPAKKPKSKKGLIAAGCGLLLLIGCVVGGVAIFWKREGTLMVASQTWTREVQIERFGPVSDSAWCDQVPAGARVDRRTRETRSHRKVADGQDCQTRRVDNGDGTFSERQECTPRYRDEAVQGDKCYFTVDRWTAARTATATGTIAQPPTWPIVQLVQAGQCVGCEREGARTETYRVQLTRSDSGDGATCDFDQARWATFTPGSQWRGEVAVLTGAIDCNSLRPK